MSLLKPRWRMPHNSPLACACVCVQCFIIVTVNFLLQSTRLAFINKKQTNKRQRQKERQKNKTKAV